MPNSSKKSADKQTLPPQHQSKQPGIESEMDPLPEYERPNAKGADKLKGRAALITGGDSGIGRAVSVSFAIEGADVAIVYKDEHGDAQKTKDLVEKRGGRALLIPGDIGDEAFCKEAVAQAVKAFGRLDILVNNAAEQHPKQDLMEIKTDDLVATYKTNILSMFHLTRAALPHLRKHQGSNIINTTSVTAYRGSPGLLDYSSTKGAIVSFTRSLSGMLAKEKIRVNAVAPGPIWTPLIPATFPPEKVKTFGSDVPLGRPGQPWEVATCYVFLASDDGSYMTGQVLHPNGGEIVNG
jgi:NAD(P)-dependent dehydrogenase (short-subunit alcohol dehydrogenase family)